MKALRALQTAFLLGGAAWFLSSREVGLAVGLVAGAVLHASVEAYRRLACARALRQPSRTVRGGNVELEIPEGWDAHGDGTGLHVGDPEVTITLTWHESAPGVDRGADLEPIAAGLLAAHAKGRTAHDVEPCFVRLLGIDARGRRAVFAGWELTIAEAYALEVPARDALVTVLAIRTEAVPEALIRRCVESVRATAEPPIERQSDSKLEIHVRPRQPADPT